MPQLDLTNAALPEGATLEEVQAVFVRDRFAQTACNEPEILIAEKGHAKVRMDVTEDHVNVKRTVMGGAMFTLADYAFAIASCIGQAPTVSVTSTIEFLNAGTGNEMYAECTMDKMGRSMCYADVKVTDENDRVLAIVKMTGYRLG
ncbi:Acyl-coenzyme A thioesterase PaaI [Slackia heliotrinireducens]|uniref:Uncharacterized conserved protein n=2 Tax=Slackia TaxID=84108 RepID=C7N332_SLAHD|nr:PaaI family thioesterase [Slackia heliotrinireducens]ACV21553.1 uncharacterized conserved protein [Slackia heliotrinireducens DSM 20476]VEG99045.1 Acyl-coenzyme A thioesterase PaaI [Slackia heliotrinireducens]